MKKILLTIFIWLIAINLMEKIDSLSTFLLSLFITIIVFIISLIIWKVIPLCKYYNKSLNKKL